MTIVKSTVWQTFWKLNSGLSRAMSADSSVEVLTKTTLPTCQNEAGGGALQNGLEMAN